MILAFLRALPLYAWLLVRNLLGRQEAFLSASWGAAWARALAPLYGGRRVDAITIAYATVFLIPDPPQDLRDHEAFHRFQSWRESPRWLPGSLAHAVGALVYGVKYMNEYRKVGYQDNCFEVEARRAAGQDPA